MLLGLGCDVNTSINEKDVAWEGETPLIAATSRGMTQLVKKLIQNGAVVSAIQKDKSDAAYYAARQGYLEV